MSSKMIASTVIHKKYKTYKTYMGKVVTVDSGKISSVLTDLVRKTELEAKESFTLACAELIIVVRGITIL